MDLRLIKKLLKKGKAKIIIVEDGKPTMVISSVDDYLMEDINGQPSNNVSSEVQKSDPEEIKEEETILLSEEQKDQESKGLTIDDLPL